MVCPGFFENLKILRRDAAGADSPPTTRSMPGSTPSYYANPPATILWTNWEGTCQIVPTMRFGDLLLATGSVALYTCGRGF